jgi:hypothetical protein
MLNRFVENEDTLNRKAHRLAKIAQSLGYDVDETWIITTVHEESASKRIPPLRAFEVIHDLLSRPRPRR